VNAHSEKLHHNATHGFSNISPSGLALLPKQSCSRLHAENMAPNPSIEGTSNIKLRLLSAAPHVKR
jgi:hypothetical protein